MEKAKIMGIPQTVVKVRNLSSHAFRPSVSQLKLACNEALEFLKDIWNQGIKSVSSVIRMSVDDSEYTDSLRKLLKAKIQLLLKKPAARKYILRGRQNTTEINLILSRIQDQFTENGKTILKVFIENQLFMPSFDELKHLLSSDDYNLIFKDIISMDQLEIQKLSSISLFESLWEEIFILFNSQDLYKEFIHHLLRNLPKLTLPATNIAFLWIMKSLNFDSSAETMYETAIVPTTDILKMETPFEQTIAYYNNGKEFLKQGYYYKAIQSFTNAINYCPLDHTLDLARCHMNKAAAFYFLKHFQDTLTDATKALELNKMDSKAFYIRAQAFKEVGELRKCLEDLNAVCMINGFADHDCLLMIDIIRKKITAEETFMNVSIPASPQPSTSTQSSTSPATVVHHDAAFSKLFKEKAPILNWRRLFYLSCQHPCKYTIFILRLIFMKFSLPSEMLRSYVVLFTSIPNDSELTDFYQEVYESVKTSIESD